MNVNGQSSRAHAYMSNHCAQLNNGVRTIKQWGAAVRAGLQNDMTSDPFQFLKFYALVF